MVTLAFIKAPEARRSSGTAQSRRIGKASGPAEFHEGGSFINDFLAHQNETIFLAEVTKKNPQESPNPTRGAKEENSGQLAQGLLHLGLWTFVVLLDRQAQGALEGSFGSRRISRGQLALAD